MSGVCLQSSIDCQFDSVDECNGNIVCGVSRTEGNVWDGKLMLLSPDGGILHEQRLLAGVSICRFSAPHNSVLAARDDGVISAHSGDSLMELRKYEGHDDVITGVSLSSLDKTLFTSVGFDGIIHNWNFECEKPISSSSISGGVIINDVCNSFQTPHMSCTVSQDGFCRLWDSREMRSGCVQMAVLNQVGSAVAWSSEVESKCLVGLADGNVASIDWRMSETVERQKLHAARINKIRLADDTCLIEGKRLYVSSSDDNTYFVSKEAEPSSDVGQQHGLDAATGMAYPNILKPIFHSSCHQDYVTDSLAVLIPALDTGTLHVVSSSVDKSLIKTRLFSSKS